MYDFHIHSRVSFDSQEDPLAICAAAKERGLREICFTDHYDTDCAPDGESYQFDLEDYRNTYRDLSYPGLVIRRGVEVGLTPDNQAYVQDLLGRQKFDFVIGSAHFVDGLDPYHKDFWVGKTAQEGIRRHLEGTLEMVLVQEDFDVLGHLTYAAKSPNHPDPKPIFYADHPSLVDEIFTALIAKGKGIEINTSGVDAVGAFLPDAQFLRRYKALGGEIVTLGSDAHNARRVGQYIPQAMELCKEIFGHVCTFQNRQCVFHKL